MRALLLVVLASSLLGCGGFKAVSRGDWRLVYDDPQHREAGSKLTIITRDANDLEVTEGRKRLWSPPPGYQTPALHQTKVIELQVGAIEGFIVDESHDTQVLVDGDAVNLFWGEFEKRDAWDGDHDVTIRQSTLYVEAKRPGKATLRVVHDGENHDVPVVVK